MHRIGAHANAVQTYFCQLRHRLRHTSVSVNIDAAFLREFPNLNNGFFNRFPHQQRLTFAALTEANYRKISTFEVRNGIFYNLARRWFEAQTVLCGGNRLAFWLKRNTPQTIGITRRTCRNWTLPTPHKIVAGSGASVGQRTIICQVFNQAILWIFL